SEAMEQGLESVVVLLVELDETGTLVSVEVVGPAGHGFDEAALEAVRQMVFGPAMTEEGPVPVLFELPYGFRFDVEEPPDEEDAPPPPVNLDGTVIEMGTRRPVQNARVVVDGTDLEATTDEEGWFELRGVPVGTQKVRVLHPGHVGVDADIEMVEGEAVTWRFWMRAESYRENEAVAIYQVEKEEVTRRTITIEEVRRVPGTFGDPIKVIQTLPGAARSPFGTGFLIIRGANPEDSGVYVDGVRIPIIYHLTGTTSVLSPELISSVDYLPGGYGTQYGRSMGGVIDVRTKDEFDDARIVWGTDILDSQLYFEGNLGKNKQHGLALGVRRSYIDVFIPLFTDSDFTIKPRYWDYQIKWVPRLKGDRDLSVFFYGFDDVLEVATPDDVAQGSDQDTQGNLRTQYASQRLLVRYQQALSDTVNLDITPSIGVDYSELALGDEFGLSSYNGLGELRIELPWAPGPGFTLVPGFDFIGGVYTFEFTSPFSFTEVQDPLAERETVNLDGSGTAWSPDLYLKALIRPLADRERLLITPGIRSSAVYFTYGGSVVGVGEDATSSWTRLAFDPRIATRFELIDGFTLKAATGIYTQPPQPYESIGVGTDVKLGYERTWNSSFGFEHQVTQAVHWDVDAFYRDMDRLVVFNDDWEGYGDVNFVNEGIGRAYGLEVIARHDPVGRFFGWVSYTLSHSERKDHPGDDWYLFDLDQTHIMSAQAGYTLPHDFGISGQVQFVTGNPVSVYDTGVYDVDWDAYNPFRIGAYNADRLPPYFQTSLRFDKLFTFKKWQLEAYVELLNAVRGVNPEFTIYNYDYTDYAYIRGIPFIPNIGVEAKFWP
ncbi:MAG: TonB family protein, partial [Deltaproteobacteria bacterium]|nr:TonB family protein [Deltaproteobacteria bacterium]